MKCCFCGTDNLYKGGNSTWPIFYQADGETHRCCDRCNLKYVIAARRDKTLIMPIRNAFGIEYEGETLISE